MKRTWATVILLWATIAIVLIVVLFIHKESKTQTKEIDMSTPAPLYYSADKGAIFEVNPDTGKLGTQVSNSMYDTPAPTPTPVDPYAQWGGTTNYNNLMSGFNNQKQGIFDSSTNAANQTANQFKWNILDAITGFKQSQRGIDQQSVQNEASKIQGGRDIMGMIGRGLKSGGTMLGNRNAGNSSAAQAIANAYSELGQRQMSTIGNQYAKNMGDIGIAQTDLTELMNTAVLKNEDSINQSINSITTAAAEKLYSLDAAMAEASMPERIAIEQEKAKVKQIAANALQKYDAELRTGIGGIKASDRGTNIGKANEQLLAGQADPNLYKYTTQAPLQVQNSGPVASNMPLYTYNSKYKQQA